jgi:hypothetical protein
MENENITLTELQHNGVSIYDILFYLVIFLIIAGGLLYIYGKSNIYITDKVKETVSWVEEKTHDFYYTILFNNKVQGNTIKLSL